MIVSNLADLDRSGLSRCGVDVVHDDPAADPGEPLGECPTNAGSCSGDHDDLVDE
jgi:hypothetical protein